MPKLAFVGFAASCAWVPVPLNARVAGEPAALLLIEMLPLVLPVDVGENFAVKMTVPPGFTD